MSAFLNLEKMHKMVPGSLILNASEEDTKRPIRLFSTDSRKIKKDDFFIALVGEQFDGNHYLHDVMKKGASGALASHQDSIPTDFPVLLVDNTLLAMQQIASSWRSELGTSIIVVTGSNGKTTVKEMIASILKEAFGSSNVLATIGNLNNEIGLPLTLLGLESHHAMAVLELGMNHPGETRILAKIAKPNIVLINNAQREHQEFMHTVEAVAKEHADAIQELSLDGVAVFPADSEFTAIWKTTSNTKKYIDFSLAKDVEQGIGKVYGSWTSEGTLTILFRNNEPASSKVTVKLNTLGDHNAKNAIAAAGVAHAAGIDVKAIQKGLENFIPVEGRMRSHQLPSFGARSCLIDDSYNANPDSVLAAIDVLAKLPGIRWLVLGDMGEVGDQGDRFHTEIGSYAQSKGIDYLYATGNLSIHSIEAFNAPNKKSKNERGVHFVEQENLVKQLKANLNEHQKNVDQQIALLVKGSRFTKMEKVVHALLKEESLCF